MTADRSLDALWRGTTAATLLVLLIGAALALAGWRAAAWLIVGAAVAGAVLNVGLSVVKYRRTMRRQWPAVGPISDDEWE